MVKRLVTLLFFFCPFASIFADEVIVLNQQEEVHKVTRQVWLFEDKSGQMTFEEVRENAAFQPANKDAVNYNITKSAIWCKARFTTQVNNDWYLEYLAPSIEVVECYRIVKNGETKKMLSGITVPPAMRSTLGNHVLFPLDLNAGDTVTVYVKVETAVPLIINFEAGSLKAFFKSDHTSNFFHGLYFGFIFIMVMYNLFLYFTNADRVYIYYVMYILFSGLFISFYTGYVLVLPSWLLWIFTHVPVLVPSLFGSFGMMFTLRFLSTKTFIPRYHKVLLYFTLLMIFPFFTSLFNRHLGVLMVQVMGIIFPVLSITAGILVLKRGSRSAKFYLIGFGAYMMGLLMLIVSDFIGIGSRTLTHYPLEIGSAFEAVILSFAIGDKLNMANREKEKAQEEALEVLRQNEKLVREQNIVLEQKVKERTAELQSQKEIIEEKNKEITDSINYAKRIQYTLLAHQQLLKENLPEHFIFFQPKDIVSGDFYWATVRHPDGHQGRHEFYLAICDSTGHGVPGAFMSLLNISFLNEAINEKNILAPNEALNHVRHRLIETISKDGQKDGMDAILVKFEKQEGNWKIEYAAANNSPVLIRHGEIIELPCDKMPVGYSDKHSPYNLYTFEPQKDDMLCLYTDGYADQFGGPKGKKFKYKNLNALLAQHAVQSPQRQSEILQEQFSQWKGELEQLDDVLVAGIKL